MTAAKRGNLQRVLDIVDAIDLIGERMNGATTDFGSDETLQAAVAHLVQRVGEAASHVSLETQRLAPHVPWTRLIGLRNLLVHRYWENLLPEVREVASEVLPAARQALADLADALGM